MKTSTARVPVTTVDAPGMPPLVGAANALVAADKGLLALDESIPTCNKRFTRLGIAQTEHNRRAYRKLIVTTRGLCASITGVILCDETIRQHATDGQAFATVLVNAGIVPGIKVDLGAQPLAAHPGEKVTEGLDVAGIVFLSGGQSGDLATARLNAINAAGRPPLPWPVAFSYGRAIQQPAVSIWDGRHTNAGRAQHAIARRAKADRDARRGQYAHTAVRAPR